jgi:tubulin polyglutamylase TTLL2
LIRKNQSLFGKTYDFIPQTYILPNEYNKFMDAFHRHKNKEWICKPTNSSKGRGITLINDVMELKYTEQSVIQKYISQPLLIRGVKWDMRIYVLITQMNPMKLYLYKEGLVRFSSDRYDLQKLGNQYSHLTNSSINKFSSTR